MCGLLVLQHKCWVFWCNLMFTCLSTHMYLELIRCWILIYNGILSFTILTYIVPKPKQCMFRHFLDTLGAPMIKQLALCSLQNGAGSMDYVHSVMLRMYDDTGEEENPLYHFQQQNQEPPNSQIIARQEPIPEWCKCGNCCTMPQTIENKCCGCKKCVTNTRRFRNYVLTLNTLC